MKNKVCWGTKRRPETARLLWRGTPFCDTFNPADIAAKDAGPSDVAPDTPV